MWKIFTLFCAYAGYRFWHADHGVLTGACALVGVLVFWSAGVMDNIARVTHNYFGEPRSKLEIYVALVNMVTCALSVLLFVLCLILG